MLDRNVVGVHTLSQRNQGIVGNHWKNVHHAPSIIQEMGIKLKTRLRLKNQVELTCAETSLSTWNM